MIRAGTYASLALLSVGCSGVPQADESPPERTVSSVEQGLVTCSLSTDTGYVSGNPFTITLVQADGKPIEISTANAYAVMQDAAAAQGINLVVVSGFRTMAEQQYLYGCYVNCNCNSCNLAAQPGYSNHQSGHALDLNTSDPGVYNWLTNNGANYGFKRTVPSEIWHWEWWGGGPGGGPCGNTPDNCTQQEAQGCGNFGCGCVDHACNGVFCAGSGCSAQHASDCGAFGCGCADGACAGIACGGSGCTAKETNDCGAFGCGCVDHACAGGACAGNGCTLREATDCGAYACNCADQNCSGGFCPGTGCTLKETTDCTAAGCGCVDHQCAGGGKCAGSGSTARNGLDCGNFGCHSVDGQCSGGFCPGTGCTAKETADCQAQGCGCADEQCSGGACMGTGCTARQTLDCTAADAGCALGQCVGAGGTFTVDAGTGPVIVDDGGVLVEADGGRVVGAMVPPDELQPGEMPPVMGAAPPSKLSKAHGGCSTADGSMVLGALLLLLRRNRRSR